MHWIRSVVRQFYYLYTDAMDEQKTPTCQKSALAVSSLQIYIYIYIKTRLMFVCIYVMDQSVNWPRFVNLG